MQYRLTFGRFLYELLYSESEYVDQFGEGLYSIDISKMARAINVRPVRLKEMVDWAANNQLLKLHATDDGKVIISLRARKWRESSYSKKKTQNKHIGFLETLKKRNKQ